MQDFEKLGEFYLGRPYDMVLRGPGEGLVLYDSRDLVTHAVIIGMTGSGKTGLGIGLLEEAALDGVPAIAIDPKGDLGNLLLTFPRLAAEDFRPWIDEADAARKGMTPEAFAAAQAEFWKKGLAEWGEDGARIERLRAAADLAIYTPGSSAGLPVSILRSFSAPPPAVANDPELLAERISTTVSGLLTLVGVEADPVRSREHILVSTILGTVWKRGQDVDLGGLISRIQSPPFTKIGVLEVDSFYPAKDRFALAMQLNALLAAPGFAAWLEGEPIDIDRMLYTASGKPRIAIVSIAHLGDNERMFFVSLLLNEVLGWMRKQAGTTSLRALIYMDEVAGFMPPVANPPSKLALLTLLKQARAFGLGVVLATQNPIDLDYKGLSNTGTWFLGRLQTEQDKARVLDGLQGAVAGGGLDRAAMDKMLSGLPKRVFLLHNVHEDAPGLFETRWTLSYLRGPLTREQIRTLTGPDRTDTGSPAVPAAAAHPAPVPVASGPGAPSAREPMAQPASGVIRPVLPPDVPQWFAPSRGASPRYEPRLWADAQVAFAEPKLDLRESRGVAVLAPFAEGPVGVDWSKAEPTELTRADLEAEPVTGATFADTPPAAAKAKNYAAWSKAFAQWLFETQHLEVVRHAETGLTSKGDEGEREFRIRLQLAMREQRDEAKTKLQQKYAPKVAALQERIRRAQMAVDREQQQASEQKMQTVVSVGATMLGALFGKKMLSSTNLGRATTAARGASRALKQSQDVEAAEENVEALQKRLADLDAELQGELAAADASADATTVPLDKATVRPKKAQITIGQVMLVWVPR